jgi:hypothetical protein
MREVGARTAVLVDMRVGKRDRSREELDERAKRRSIEKGVVVLDRREEGEVND